MELRALVWCLEPFRLHIYARPIEVLTDHQALETLIKKQISTKTHRVRITH